MKPFVLTPVQQENHTFLTRVRDLCITRPADAALIYSLNFDAIQCYGALTDKDILSLSYEADISLFVPRYDCPNLQSLLSKPVHVRGVFLVSMNNTGPKHHPSFAQESK